MPKANVFPIRKPPAQHKAEMEGIGGDLANIATEIDRAALAVIGLVKELDESCDNGESLADWLRGIATKIHDVMTRLSRRSIWTPPRAIHCIGLAPR